MPRAPKHCGINGCTVLVHNGQRCPDHQHRWGKGNPRTSTTAHRARRLRVLKRDRYQCQLRYDCCIGTATIADHTVALALGGTDEVMQAACKPCHDRKSSREGHLAQGHTPKAP